MSGASLPATQAADCTNERARRSPRTFRCGAAGRAPSSGRPRLKVPAVRCGSRGCIRTEKALSLRHAPRTFRCAAPARCGAFADERRIVVGDEEGAGVLTRVPVPGRIVCSGLCAVERGRGRRPPAGRVLPPRSSHRRAHRRVPCAAPARCGTIIDRPRIVGDDEGRRVRMRNTLSAVILSRLAPQIIDERARPWPCHSRERCVAEPLAAAWNGYPTFQIDGLTRRLGGGLP